MTSTSCPIVLMHNINSISNNLENFLLQSSIVSNINSVNIMCFCETRLSSDIEHLYTIKGYKIFTNNRNHSGGEVCIYVKNVISCHVLQDRCLASESVESVC